MSSVLYYSNYCEHSQEVIRVISKTTVKDNIHFVCVDTRVKGEDNATYVVLSDGSTKVLLPPSIVKVPALLLLDRGHHVLFGPDILNHLNPQIELKQNQSVPANASGEPEAFSLGTSGFGVASDTFSFLNQSSDEMSAKGDGGMRQTHHYVDINHIDSITTPPDNYEADTIGQVSLEQLRQQRDQDVNFNKPSNM